MREEIRQFAYGRDLFVYPFVAENAPDNEIVASARVEATHYPQDAVHLNLAFSRTDPLTREQWQQVIKAVQRCWQWIDETRLPV